MSEQNLGKKAAAKAALSVLMEQIKTRSKGEGVQTKGMQTICIGLGTGSTSSLFLEVLGEFLKQQKTFEPLHGFPTSEATKKRAIELFIPLLDTLSQLDMTIDGADWVDPQGCVIKGYGGALLREKIVAYASRKLLLLVDESKLTSTLEGKYLPIEILPFGKESTLRHLSHISDDLKIRTNRADEPYLTDNGNFIVDLKIPQHRSMTPQELSNQDPSNKAQQYLHSLNRALKSIPGVIETGLFLDFHPQVIIGRHNGSVTIWNK